MFANSDMRIKKPKKNQGTLFRDEILKFPILCKIVFSAVSGLPMNPPGVGGGKFIL